MCSHCGWDEEPEDEEADALIAEGAKAARNVRFLLDHRGEMLPEEAA